MHIDRTASRPWLWLTLVALAVALVTAAHAKTVRDADPRIVPPIVPSKGSTPDAIPLQAPPVRERLTKLAFVSGNDDLIRLVVTNDSAPPDSTYANKTEYWSATQDTSIESVSSLQLTSVLVERLTGRDIDAYLLPTRSWGPVVSWTQEIGTSGWTQGTYTPKAARKRLFVAVDPDDAQHRIGLLFEQDSNNTLVAMTWYKSSLTGTIFASIPEKLSFTEVLDATGRPSLDPRDIDAKATWYYATGP